MAFFLCRYFYFVEAQKTFRLKLKLSVQKLLCPSILFSPLSQVT